MRLQLPGRLLCLRGVAWLTLALHVSAPWLQETWAWGVWPATYLPPLWRWGLAALAILIGWPSIARRTIVWLDSIFARLPAHRLPLLLGLGSLIPFWLFRLVHTRWGDAYLLSQAIAHPEVRLTYNWQAPLTVFLHARLWAFGAQRWGWVDAAPAYALTSTLAGGLFVYVLAQLARDLARAEGDRLAAIAPFGLVATLGTMQLFFGYVENYSLMTLGMLVYLWLAWRCLAGKVALIWPATALAITHALHPSSIVLAPSLLYLGWRWARRGASRRAFGALVQIALPMLIVAGGVVALMTAGGHGVSYLFGADRPGGGDGRWLVPLWTTTTRWEHYTMFSWGHLVDIINQQLLVAPVVLPALLCLLVGARSAARVGTPWTRLLLLASGCSLLFIWTWNPDYGGQRDWDLFAPAAIPLALLLADRLGAAFPARTERAAAALALAAAQAVHTAAWIYQNTRPWSWS